MNVSKKKPKQLKSYKNNTAFIIIITYLYDGNSKSIDVEPGSVFTYESSDENGTYITQQCETLGLTYLDG